MPSPLTGGTTVTGLASPVPVSALPVGCTAYEIKAPLTNALPVWVGPSNVTSTTGHQLDPGDTIGYEKNSQHGQTRLELGPGDIYVVGTPSDRVTWFASPSL